MPILPPIQASYAPTLAQVLASRLDGEQRARRVVTGSVAAFLVLLGAFLLLRAAPDTHAIVRSPVRTFNFRYQAPMRREAPGSGEMLRLEARRGPLFLSSFVVRPLRLAPYTADLGSVLPLAALAEERELARRYTGFTVVGEGRQRVNTIAAYQILFEARLGTRHLFGRDVLLPQPTTGARTGIRLELVTTPAGGAGAAAAVGNSGALALPFRSLRFGTEGP